MAEEGERDGERWYCGGGVGRGEEGGWGAYALPRMPPQMNDGHRARSGRRKEGETGERGGGLHL